MPPILQKTLGGLSPQYYFRQLFFGLLLAALFTLPATQGNRPASAGIWIFIAISTILYPYSRFVYESLVRFILGNNVFFANAILVLMTKLFTMILCWACAIFIAPVGLAYLYYHHSK